MLKTVMRTTLLVFVVLALAGCLTRRELYPEKDVDQVWTAMVATAENPTYYSDWIITENHVTPEPETGEIHIYREIRRDHVHPEGHKRQQRIFAHRVYLRDTSKGPMIKFRSRRLNVPGRARGEAEAFFDDVWELLGGRPMPAIEEDAPEDAPIDIDTLEGG